MSPRGKDPAAFESTDGDSKARSAALDELLVAVADVHLTPVDDSTVVATAATLLDDALADYEISEITARVSYVSDAGRFKRDLSGRIVPQLAGRSPLQTARAFALARDRAAVLADLDAPRALEVPKPSAQRVLNHRLLNASQERRIAIRAATGDRGAINEMVIHNTRLAWSLTKSFARVSSGAMDREDYFQEACLGLIRAAEKFDPTRGFRFSTYASGWINQAARRAQADRGRSVRLPVHVYERARRVRAVALRDEVRLGVMPDPVEIARTLETLPADVARLLEVSEPVQSFDAEPTVLERFERNAADDTETPPVTRAELVALVDYSLAPRERDVVRLRFGLDDDHEHTLEEVGRRLGVTRERVRQMQNAALGKLRPLLLDLLYGQGGDAGPGHPTKAPARAWTGSSAEKKAAKSHDQWNARSVERGKATRRNPAELAPRRPAMNARELLQALVLRPLTTISGRTNRILKVEADSVIVSTDRSPAGGAIPIAWVQDALDELYAEGEVEISVIAVGYRSAFIGAVLKEIPGASIVHGTTPPRIRIGSRN